ncbi:hypothetical protein ABBQ32_007659 [Trebouxia sp. C0010 RCD-2024]
MPTIASGSGTCAADIYYEVRGDTPSTSNREPHNSTEVNILMIMGFGATLDCWEPQLDGLLRPEAKAPGACVRVCLLDNRGVGRSSSPTLRQAYSTSIMADDCIAVLDVLHWEQVHVIGHSMGAMVATQLASMHPEKFLSLTLISVTAGRWQAVPANWAAIKYAWQTLWAKSIEDRAKVDLKLHFMRKTLNEVDAKHRRTRRDLLHEEYVEGQKGGGVGQPDAGFKGQLHAVWTHRVDDKQVAAIKSGRFPMMVIHGRYDILAAPKHGETLAARLECPCMRLEGAHFVTRECGPEINLLLNHMVYHGQRIRNNPRKYLKPAGYIPVDLQNGITLSGQGSEQMTRPVDASIVLD